MASAPAATGINLTAHFDKARSEYEQAQAQMLLRAQALETMQKELKQAQQAVLDRERELLSAATKDGVTAATATAVILAGNPAGAAKIGAAAMSMGKGATVAALGWKQHLIAGGVARGVAVGTLFPVDSIKTKMQIGQKVSLRLDTIGVEHFKGFSSALLGQIPYGMLVFGTYETLKSKIFANNPSLNESFKTKIPVFVGCACVGDTIGAIWLTPSEIIKQKLQSGAAKDLPYRAMQLPLYEVCRDLYQVKYCAPYDRGIFPHEAMIVGASVGMLSAGLTTPLDVVKSRMMVGTAAGMSVPQVVKSILAEAGPAGLFAGVKQRVGYLGLSNGIFFIMYEFARGLLVDAPTIQMGSS